MNESLVNRVYNNTIRPFLPRKIAVQNGVATRSCRLLDRTDVTHDTEAPCVDAIHDRVQPDDHILILGGGCGVTPVHAARQGATVTVIEAAAERVEDVHETLALNNINRDRVAVEHAVVEADHDVWGTPGDTIHASDLPDCDYLEVDVEGAEADILPELDIQPRVIAVEYHPPDVTEEWTRSQLDRLGYDVVERGAEVEGEAIVLVAEAR